MILQPTDVAPGRRDVNADVVVYEKRWCAEYWSVRAVEAVIQRDWMAVIVCVHERTVPGTVHDAGH